MTIPKFPPRRPSRAAGRVWTVFHSCHLLPAFRLTLSVFDNVSSRVVNTTCHFSYNFQRRMSRLEQRWRAQRSVISIVNCRIPWTNRDLNVYCAFGISLKACLLQCLLIFMPHAISKAIWFCLCAYLCVKALSVLDTFSAQVLSSTSNLNNTSVSCVALLLVACLPQFKTVWSHSWHEVRLANPLNLSI